MPKDFNHDPSPSIQPPDKPAISIPASPCLPVAASPRKRGAPTGNQNAIKHGFYSRALKVRDRKGLENTIQVNLAEEIDLLRILIRRVCESFSPDQDNAEQSNLLRSLSLAFLSLNRMVRTQHQLLGETSGLPSQAEGAELRQAFEKALVQVTHEVGIDERFPTI